MMIRAVLLCFAFVAAPKSFADLPDFTEIVESASPAVVKFWSRPNPRILVIRSS